MFERAGVNISVVAGKLRSEAVKAMNSQSVFPSPSPSPPCSYQ